MSAQRVLFALSILLVHCHSIINFEELTPGEAPGPTSAGPPGAGQAGQTTAGQAGAGTSRQGGDGGQSSDGGAGQGGAGQGGSNEAGASSAGSGGDAGSADGGQAGAPPGPEAGKPCEGNGAVCVGDDLFRCQTSLWTKQTCAHGCLPEQVDCLRFTQIGAGNPFTCALRSDGTVWCWGGNGFELNLNIPLGILGQPANKLGLSDTPVQIGGLSGVKQLVVGVMHACALVDQGQVLCWGNNATSRQLGRSKDVEYAWEPASVPGLPGGIEELVAGNVSTCARSGDGGIYCWGRRIDGQPGGIETLHENGAEPQPQLEGVTALTIGDTHACGLFSGKIKCWGTNWAGQLALGGTDPDPHPLPTPAQVPPLAWSGLFSYGGVNFAWTNNEFYGWGPNDYSLFGFVEPGALPPNNLKPFWKYFNAESFIVKQVGAGFWFSCALIEEDGVRHVRCAGLNDAFQCGGTEPVEPDPRDISEGKKILKSEAIAVGWRHACAIVLGGESIKCWGIAHGNGTDIDTPTPFEVAWPP